MTAELWIGDTAPDFTVPCVNGGEFVLSSEVKRSPVLLYFYPANYGLMCTYYSERMNEFYEDFEALRIKVFHVNPDTVDNHKKWMGRIASRYDHIADMEHTVSKIFGMIIGAPGSQDDCGLTNRGFVLIDKKMTIRYIWKAALPPQAPELKELIEELRKILKRSES
jgi:peroxiredoxin